MDYLIGLKCGTKIKIDKTTYNQLFGSYQLRSSNNFLDLNNGAKVCSGQISFIMPVETYENETLELDSCKPVEEEKQPKAKTEMRYMTKLAAESALTRRGLRNTHEVVQDGEKYIHQLKSGK